METLRTGPVGETVDTPRHRALGSTTRVEILRLVRTSPAGVTVGEVASRTGLHLSTVRAHLDRLTEAGLLVRARARGDGLPGRPPWRYRPAPTAAAPAPGGYRWLAAALLDALTGDGADAPARATRIGQEWGHRLTGTQTTSGDDSSVDTLVDVLTELGFSPARQPGTGPTTEIHLQSCPFLELVASHPDTMCALHLGVVRGVMEHRGAAVGTASLEPFGAPHACVVQITHGHERSAPDTTDAPESTGARAGRP